MTKKIIKIFLLLSLCLGVFIFFTAKKPKESKVFSSGIGLSISVVSSENKSIELTSTLTGYVTAKDEVIISTELSGGKIDEIKAETGDKVIKNQILAVLNKDGLYNQMLQDKADYDRARDEFLRIDRLKNTGAVSAEAVNQKKAIMQVASAKYENSKLNLSKTQIKTPSNGTIYERKAQLGMLVAGNSELFKVAKESVIEVEATAPESVINKLLVGQLAFIEITGINQKLQGAIRLISPKIDGANRTGLVGVSLPEKTFVPVGTYAKVTINNGVVNGFVIPKTALQQDPTGDYIYTVLTDKKIARKNVEVVYRDDDNVVLKELEPNLKIVAKAGAFLKEGDVVNIVENK